MSKTYDLVGEAFKTYLKTADLTTYNKCFPGDVTPADLLVNGIVANAGDPIPNGNWQANISSVLNNFVANGMTYDGKDIATLGTDFIPTVADGNALEAIAAESLQQLGSTVYIVVTDDTATEADMQGLVEAAVGQEFSDLAVEWSYTTAGSVVGGILGTVTFPGSVLTGTAQVYVMGSETSLMVPAAFIGEVEFPPVA